MKIRSITIGTNFSYPIKESKIVKTAQFLSRARKIFEEQGLKVQTVRLATQPWQEYLGTLPRNKIVNVIKNIEDCCLNNGIDFVSIGTVQRVDFIDIIPRIVQATSGVSTSVTIGDSNQGIGYPAITKTARVILQISKKTTRDYGNFRFAAISNCPPDTPFFPAGYHRGRTCFSIALECSDLVARAFSKARDVCRAERNLNIVLEHEFKKIEKIAKKIGRTEKVLFKGIDVSPAPSLKKKESLAFAFEKLSPGKFGGPGTLAIAGMVTRVLQSLKIKKCGYSGLMLPILEDYGLAQRFSQGFLDIDKILAYSSVCGTGLDCVPLPGNISEDKIRAILLDVATLSLKLNKPLSARLFPIPGKKAGEMTDFKSPYLVDSRILPIR
jgi:uncharacterized protein (UPF0210 family)